MLWIYKIKRNKRLCTDLTFEVSRQKSRETLRTIHGKGRGFSSSFSDPLALLSRKFKGPYQDIFQTSKDLAWKTKRLVNTLLTSGVPEKKNQRVEYSYSTP